MNRAIAERLRFIDFLLATYGTFNRIALMDYFGVSQPQASMDVKMYTANAPDNLRYDSTTKCYRRSDSFVRRWP